MTKLKIDVSGLSGDIVAKTLAILLSDIPQTIIREYLSNIQTKLNDPLGNIELVCFENTEKLEINQSTPELETLIDVFVADGFEDSAKWLSLRYLRWLTASKYSDVRTIDNVFEKTSMEVDLSAILIDNESVLQMSDSYDSIFRDYYLTEESEGGMSPSEQRSKLVKDELSPLFLALGKGQARIETKIDKLDTTVNGSLTEIKIRLGIPVK